MNDQAYAIAGRLIGARQARGLSVNELGRRAGLAGGVISRAETGARMPGALPWVRIAEVLDCSLDWLLRGIGPAGSFP